MKGISYLTFFNCWMEQHPMKCTVFFIMEKYCLAMSISIDGCSGHSRNLAFNRLYAKSKMRSCVKLCKPVVRNVKLTTWHHILLKWTYWLLNMLLWLSPCWGWILKRIQPDSVLSLPQSLEVPSVTSNDFLIHELVKQQWGFWGLVSYCLVLYSTSNRLQIWLLLACLNMFIYNTRIHNFMWDWNWRDIIIIILIEKLKLNIWKEDFNNQDVSDVSVWQGSGICNMG